MKYIIYKITNLINNNIYIGQHATEDVDDDYMGSGVALNKAIKKYGKENFIKEILYIYNSREEANEKEKELVDAEFIEREDVYNLIEGGMFCSASSKLGTLGLQEKIKNETFKKKWVSNISKGLKKYYQNNKPWNKNLKGVLKANKTSFKKGNIPWNKSMVGWKRNVKVTEATRLKIRESKIGDKNPMSVKIIRLKDLKIYNTEKECALDNKISTRTIYAHCNGQLKNKAPEFMYYSSFIKGDTNG